MAVACADAGETDVTVPWRLGAGTCAEAGVETVRAELFDSAHAEPVAVASAPCDAGEVAVVGVSRGERSVRVVGGRPDCDTYEAWVRAVSVHGAEVALEPVLLGPRPRPLRLDWRFADAAPCASHGVVQVEALVEVGDTAPVRAVWLCGALSGEVPSVVAGPARIALRGLDAAGTTVARADATFPEADLLPDVCAESFSARLTLTACAQAGCP